MIGETEFDIWNGKEESRYGYGGVYTEEPVFERQTIRVEIYICDVTINPANSDNTRLLEAIDRCDTQRVKDWNTYTDNERLLSMLHGHYGDEFRFAEILEVAL
jgi:hypothetical protein